MSGGGAEFVKNLSRALQHPPVRARHGGMRIPFEPRENGPQFAAAVRVSGMAGILPAGPGILPGPFGRGEAIVRRKSQCHPKGSLPHACRVARHLRRPLCRVEYPARRVENPPYPETCHLCIRQPRADHAHQFGEPQCCVGENARSTLTPSPRTFPSPACGAASGGRAACRSPRSGRGSGGIPAAPNRAHSRNDRFPFRPR